MEKLELKHIVGYLPYGLPAKLSREGVFNLDSEYPNEHKYKLCSITDFTTYSKDLGGSMKVNDTNDYSFDFDSLDEIEIVLRPLSDLTKEIEVNEEKFVPIDVISDIFPIDIDEDGICSNGTDEFGLNYLPYVVIQKLYEWHFDIHGLIEKGLAIDINTLDHGIQ